MKLRNAEWKETTILRFIVEEGQGPDRRNVFVDYLSLSKVVSCRWCKKGISCEHIQFIQDVFDRSPAWQINDFIRGCTGSGRTPEFIGEMQRAFDVAVGKRKPPKRTGEVYGGWLEYPPKTESTKGTASNTNNGINFRVSGIRIEDLEKQLSERIRESTNRGLLEAARRLFTEPSPIVMDLNTLPSESGGMYTTYIASSEETRLDPAAVEKAKKALTEKKKAKPAKPAKPRTRFTDLEL